MSVLGVVQAEQSVAQQKASAEPNLLFDAVTAADYQQALLALTPKQQQMIMNDSTRQRELLFELSVEKQLVREAQRRGLDQQPEAQARVAQSSRKVLVDMVVRQEQENMNLVQPDFSALAEEYYLTHKQEFVQPERIKVAHILWEVRCDCEDKDGTKRTQAEAVLKELRAGADFAELARNHSDDKASASKGGELDWVTRGKFVKSFEEAAFALREPGSISDVIKTEYGYHVIKLVEYEPKSIQPFAQVKDSIIPKLASKFKTVSHKAFVAQYYPTTAQFNEAVSTALPKVAD
jgi:peptidyl-prolyl cis-trans isomerase C